MMHLIFGGQLASNLARHRVSFDLKIGLFHKKTPKKSLGSTLRIYLIVRNNNRKNNELQIKFREKLFLCVLYLDG